MGETHVRPGDSVAEIQRKQANAGPEWNAADIAAAQKAHEPTKKFEGVVPERIKYLRSKQTGEGSMEDEERIELAKWNLEHNQ